MTTTWEADSDHSRSRRTHQSSTPERTCARHGPLTKTPSTAGALGMSNDASTSAAHANDRTSSATARWITERCYAYNGLSGSASRKQGDLRLASAGVPTSLSVRVFRDRIPGGIDG